jgi:hypothetical protein
VVRAADAEPEGKALRLAQRDRLCRALLLRDDVTAEHVDGRLEDERERQAERVIEPVRERHRCADARECRVGLTEVPEVLRGKAENLDALIRAEHPDQPVVLHRIVKLHAPFAVRERRRELPLVRLGQRAARMPDKRLLSVATRLGCRDYLGQQRSPALDLAASVVADSQPRARDTEPRRVARRRAQLRRPLVGRRRVWVRVAARGDERAAERELERSDIELSVPISKLADDSVVL